MSVGYLIVDEQPDRAGDQGHDPPFSRWLLLATLSKITSLQPGDAVTD